MNMIWTTLYTSFLYYCCLLLIAYFLLFCTPRTIVLCCSFVAFIPLIILATLDDVSIFSPAYMIFELAQFFLLKVSFENLKMRSLIIPYVFLYCTNMILVSLIVTIFPSLRFLADYLVNTALTMLCAYLCLSKNRNLAQQILLWIPKRIKIIVLLLLIATSAIFAFISGSDFFVNYGILNHALRIVIIILLFAVCAALPVFILIAVSNTQLKSLSAEYEQQIHAHAEHYKALAAANFETRRFKHDFKNISIGIEKMLADGNYEQAIDYLRSYNRNLNTPGIFCSAFDTGNGIADALLADKQERASACNTIIVFHGALPVNFLSPTDLCVVLGNSLDNAIEACQMLSPEQVKTISLDCTCNSGFLFLTISNPVDHKVAIRDNYVATTKENKTLHGFGLYSLHSVVKKYNGDIRLTSTDTSFTINIDLCMVSSQKSENSLPL